MLYLAIPAHNEVATIGVLLWRIRTVLAEFPREYEVVVYDDASSDETAEVAEQYAHAMPVTVLRGTAHVGYAGALDALIRHVSAQTRYPRRDAMLLVQGDFTDPPGIVPEFARRFEGGADLVVGERMVVADAPVPVRRLFKAAHWAMRPFVRVDGVNDLTASMRLIRISALRDLVRQAGSEPICVGDSWTANADLLLKLVPLARRVESVPMEPTYGVRMRDTRRVAVRDALAALKWAWGARGRRAVAGSAADAAGDAERRPPRGVAPAGKRREETELSVEKLRERVRDRPRIEDEESFNGRREGRRRERERAKGERPVDEPIEAPSGVVAQRDVERDVERDVDRVVERAAEKPATESRPPRAERPERPKRPRAETNDGEAKPARPERLPRGERPAKSSAPRPPRRGREESRSPYSDPSVELEDPFAAPSAKRDGPERALERALGPVDAIEPSPDARDDESGDDADTGDGDAFEAGDGAGGIEGDESAAPRKKRRRNRRSRRGRTKKDGTAGDGTSEEGAEADADSSSASPPGDIDSDLPVAGAPPRSRTRAPKEDTEDGDGDSDGDAGDGDEALADGDESDLDSAARARRRGRRGRRGGARRSRGRRDKDGGDGGEPESGSAGADG
ncbi:glycosyltransferase [Gemmatimonas sp.]|uniref:glycosyltransferase n=1 Tax=Gemmatimonas sp. TaxID=1962908 RepID=UPI00286A31A0|nr:glycosyltransferase [Gemmatimonas sp.]